MYSLSLLNHLSQIQSQIETWPLDILGSLVQDGFSAAFSSIAPSPVLSLGCTTVCLNNVTEELRGLCGLKSDLSDVLCFPVEYITECMCCSSLFWFLVCSLLFDEMVIYK